MSTPAPKPSIRVGNIVLRTGVLAFVVTGTGGSRLAALSSWRHTTAIVLLAVCAATWVVWTVAGSRLASSLTWFGGPLRAELPPSPLTTAATIAMGVAGGVLTGLMPDTAAVTFPCAAAIMFGVRFGAAWAVSLTALIIGVLIVSCLAFGHSDSLGFTGLVAGLFALGNGRRAYVQRAVQAERLLAETRRANAEEATAAALAERTRIAREIHDVLAHSLAALTVQLEAADALLTEGHDAARAHEHVRQAQHISREGLVETRRAITALREDAPPLPDLLRRLAKLYEDDSGAPVEMTVSGSPRPLSPDAGLALYRTAQEAFTNVRKHAAGARVTCVLAYDEAATELTIRNTLPDGPAAHSGGYGLTGMRERATLLDGTLTAGPDDDEWRVTVRIPYRAGGAA